MVGMNSGRSFTCRHWVTAPAVGADVGKFASVEGVTVA
jgi:hypothetical protein